MRARSSPSVLGATLLVAVVASACGDDPESKEAAAARLRQAPQAADAAADILERRATLERLWTAVDQDDLDAFARICGQAKDGAVVDVDRKSVESMLADLHQRYGLRPRAIGIPNPVEGTRGEFESSVVFGQDEETVVCAIRKDAAGNWRLVRVSDGGPGSADDMPGGSPTKPPR